MNTARHRELTAAVLVTACLLLPVAAGAWTLELADTVEVAGERVTVADVARGAVPGDAGAVVLVGGGRPGASVEIGARTVLRRLVMAGLADGVSLSGAASCRVEFGGRAVATGDLADAVRQALAPHVPPAPTDAPPSWLELEIPDTDLHAAGAWSVDWPRPRALEPGRNLVTVAVREGARTRRLSVVAVLHAYGQTAVPVSTVPRGQQPAPGQVQWTWTDLALITGDPVVDPRALAGMIAARDLLPGEMIAVRDLEPKPLVRRGEQVDLVVRRGGIAAVVAAECRQDGLLDETVSIRSKLDGRLLVARVTGPGTVTLGR
jgi:flagella basal body P-ring formation protein FlgA